MTSLDRLEHETEATRMRVSELLDELRERVSPGELVDQLVDVAGAGAAGDFARNLGSQVRNNPLACALIGAGLAWLIIGDRRGGGGSASSGDLSDATARARAAAHHMGDAAADTSYRAAATAGRMATGAAEGVGRTGSSLAEAAADASSTLADRAQDVTSGVQAMAEVTADMARTVAGATSDTVQGAAQGLGRGARGVGRSAGDMGRRAGNAITQAAQLIQDQPLIAAGLGIAIGAALGAALPPTEIENRLIGERADDIKARAREAAAEQVEKARKVAERTYDVAKEDAGHVAHEAARAAGEEGFPAGTLRAEHEQDQDARPGVK
jgi:ElaB/YqjD/DUF883 family membrane-anchored ribosome-binding protein